MRILPVEDDVPLAETLRGGLVDAGYAVDVMRDGVVGLWAAGEHPYDVIMLPGASGYEVCPAARAGVDTPVLMLTAKDGEYDALDLGADDYLTKPFSFVVLLARLRALARRGAPDRPPVLIAGDLIVDPARHRVTRGRRSS
ncbi:hypothetical protein Psuf_061660 [Phytohabitans suffuscus]|uniref:Response regulatory domain-containing protein n=1 Tax=Phytohabitans suffuscus TaxID=624315 RepID=A0A6F8YS88_9ACTN|nr:hypothetical protein Psuf_061660 [Phytohabitans suffuscus]